MFGKVRVSIGSPFLGEILFDFNHFSIALFS